MEDDNRNAIFASDNSSGVHPQIRKAIDAAAKGHVVAYGNDPYTRAAVKKFRQHFGESIDVFTLSSVERARMFWP